MKRLDWFQARTLARNGTAIRRDPWRKWLTFESYVWLITQPVWETQTSDRRVVQQWDFGADEFLAHDWTDEPWPGGPQPPDPPDGPQPPDPPRTSGGGGNGGGNGGNGGNGGDGDDGDTGGGWLPGGGGGGPQPPVPPKDPEPHNPPQENVPTITVEVNVDINPDGPSCFIQPPQTCTAYVNVTIAGGPAGVGSLRVSGIGTPSPQIASGWPGMSQGFTFKDVPVNPGGTITFTADYGAPGNVPLVHYIGTGSHKFLPRCILFIASWNGSVTTDSVCTHSGQSGSLEDGYNYAASYSVNGQYAVNPEDGSGKTARRTTADVNEGDPKIHWTNDTIPDGTHTEGDIPIYPPRSVTVDVQNGSVSNLQPDSLKRFGSDQHNVTENPHCSFDKTTDEQSSL